MKKSIYLIICSIIIFSSCSVEKRVYNTGYHISWNSKQKADNKKESIDLKKEIKNEKNSQHKDKYGDEIIQALANSQNELEADLIIYNLKSKKIVSKRELSPKINNTTSSLIQTKEKHNISTLKTIKKISNAKKALNKHTSSSGLADILIKLLIIILLLILITILLSLLGGIIGSLLSLLLFLLLLYFLLKLLGVI